MIMDKKDFKNSELEQLDKDSEENKVSIFDVQMATSDFYKEFNKTITTSLMPLTNSIQPIIDAKSNCITKVVDISNTVNGFANILASNDNIFKISNSYNNWLSSYSNVLNTVSNSIKTSELTNFHNNLVDSMKNLKSISFVLDEYVDNFNNSWLENIRNNAKHINTGIEAQNLAMLRLLPNYEKMDLPYGSKKILKSLTKPAAIELTKTDGFLFDPKEGEFYHKDSPKIRATADQITIAESSLDLLGGITLQELLEFENQLFDDEYFASEHKVGKKIFNIIKQWDKFVNLEDIKYFHARVLEDDMPYLEYQMLKAPTNVSSHGRYNKIGKSCYYFCESKEDAINEIKKHCGGKKVKIQIAGLVCTKNPRILDLSGEPKKSNTFVEHLRYSVDFEKENGKIIRQYLLPNFVAACCRKLKIEGIKYKSGSYNCYVLWDDGYFDFAHELDDIVER